MKAFLIPIALFILASCNSKKKADTDSNKTTVDNETTTTQNNPPPPEAETHASIVGKWILSEVSNKDMTEEEKKEIIGQASVEFKADGKYTSHSDKVDERGTYMYYENTKTLTTTAEGEREEKVTANIGNDKLIVTNEDGTMIFKRINQ